MVAPTVTDLADALADVPEGTRIMRSSVPGPDGTGFATLWLVFADPEARRAYLLRYLRTWIVTADRCSLLDYWVDWLDIEGYGLEMTTFRRDQIGADRHVTRPVRGGGAR